MLVVTAISVCVMDVNAQNGLDPLRSVLFMRYAEKHDKTLKTLNTRESILDADYFLMNEEININLNFQKEFNDYLDSFHDVISILAEFYGVYYELNISTRMFNDFKDAVAENPEGILAVSISQTTLQRKLVLEAGEIVSDIRLAVVGMSTKEAQKSSQTDPNWKKKAKNAKMTQAERLQLISKIRKKIRIFNDDMKRLNLLVRHSSLIQVWERIWFRYQDRLKEENRKIRIINERKIDWRINIRNSTRNTSPWTWKIIQAD